jgi:hypothetical protein
MDVVKRWWWEGSEVRIMEVNGVMRVCCRKTREAEGAKEALVVDWRS